MATPGRFCCIAFFSLLNCLVCTEGLQAVVSQSVQVRPAGNSTMELEHDQEPSNRTTAAVFSDLLNSADELKRQIEDAEKASVEKIRGHEDSLKATLEEMRADAARMEDQSQQLRGEIQVIRGSNDKLFTYAKKLKLEAALWRDDWKELEANVSLAIEVTRKSWDEVNESLGADDMYIISEMNQEAWNDEVSRYRSELLRTVGGEGDGLSLLALQDPERRAFRKASSIVSILDGELHDMTETYAVLLKKLDEKYSLIFTQQVVRMETIRRDHANLIQIKQSDEELQGKLQVAVDQLEGLKEKNEKKGYLVRQFARELGLNALPTSGTIGEDWDNLLDREASQQQRLQTRASGVAADDESKPSASAPSVAGDVPVQDNSSTVFEPHAADDPLLPNASAVGHIEKMAGEVNVTDLGPSMGEQEQQQQQQQQESKTRNGYANETDALEETEDHEEIKTDEDANESDALVETKDKVIPS